MAALSPKQAADLDRQREWRHKQMRYFTRQMTNIRKRLDYCDNKADYYRLFRLALAYERLAWDLVKEEKKTLEQFKS